MRGRAVGICHARHKTTPASHAQQQPLQRLVSVEREEVAGVGKRKHRLTFPHHNGPSGEDTQGNQQRRAHPVPQSQVHMRIDGRPYRSVQHTHYEGQRHRHQSRQSGGKPQHYGGFLDLRHVAGAIHKRTKHQASGIGDCQQRARRCGGEEQPHGGGWKGCLGECFQHPFLRNEPQ